MGRLNEIFDTLSGKLVLLHQKVQCSEMQYINTQINKCLQEIIVVLNVTRRKKKLIKIQNFWKVFQTCTDILYVISLELKIFMLT